VPYRVLDTRDSHQTLGQGAKLTVQIAGSRDAHGVVGVPATGASAVTINVTVTNTSTSSFLSVYPGTYQPVVSSLNWAPGQTVANLVQVTLAADGSITLYNSNGQVDVVIDVAGYFVPTKVSAPTGLLFSPEPTGPVRILDTRDTHQPLHQGSTMTLPLGAVPPNSQAVVMNVTVTNGSAGSFLTVWPHGAAQPLASNLNWPAGRTVPNRVTVQIGSANSVDFYNSNGDVDVVVDLSGFYTTDAVAGAHFVPTSPHRVLDSRYGSGPICQGCSVQFGFGGADPEVDTPTQHARGVVLNVTVTDTTAGSFLTLWTHGSSQPLASDLNWYPGQTVPNLVIVQMDSDGVVNLYNSNGNVDVVIDVVGYYWR
jgi:hypothetical protein